MIKSPIAPSMSNGLIELDPDGKIIKANADAKKLLIKNKGSSKSIFQKVKSNEIKTKLHECFMGKINKFVATVDSLPYFFLFHRSVNNDILKHVHLYIFNMNDLQNSYENNNLNNHLLSSIGEMAAGIAHEVRNPLTSVKGFLQLMEQGYKEEYSTIAQNELDRAINILNDLMSVSKPEFIQETKTTFNVCAEIESILLLFQNQLYHINLKKRFSNRKAMIFGRRDQIKKALFNIIKNAIEAMPKGGTLLIEQYENVHEIHINISDTGVGIPKDKLRLLGTPFFTLKKDGKGMGLAQVFNAVQGNHGRVRVSSKEGDGTTFFLSFTKIIQQSNPFIGGKTMVQTIGIKSGLSEFLKENLSFYTEEWIQYLHKNKSYITSLLKENGEMEEYKTNGNPIIRIVIDNIHEIKTEEIMDLAKDRGVKSAKTEFPMHLAWELFQSTRGILWNAIRSYYTESKTKVSTEEFFALERDVNDIIDLYIDSYTAYYVNYQDELLKSHRETVDELSVPIIPIAEHICILPIVGNVDTYRAKKIREKTLVRVKELKAQKLIIDISGVPYVDTAVVNHLFKIVRGIKLLGCCTILTGISAEIADTMIELGIEIDDELKTRSDLQQALSEIKAF